MADDKYRAEIEAIARALYENGDPERPSFDDSPIRDSYLKMAEVAATELDRVRDARGDDEACPDCWGGRPKWAGTMPAPPCPTCDGTGRVSPSRDGTVAVEHVKRLVKAARAYFREFDHLIGERDYPERRNLRDALAGFEGES